MLKKRETVESELARLARPLAGPLCKKARFGWIAEPIDSLWGGPSFGLIDDKHGGTDVWIRTPGGSSLL